MGDEKKPVDFFTLRDSAPLTSKEGWDDKPIGNLREMLKGNSEFTGFWMNPHAAGKLFDLCHGSKELPDQDGKMHPCVGCRGCKPELAEEPKIDDYVPEPTVSGVRLK